MIDPLNDPRFPDRPSHPDYWRLSEVAMMLDGRSNESGRSVQAITQDFIDLNSLMYMARNRTQALADAVGLGSLPPEVMALAISCQLGGIVHGIGFERAGGHRE